MSSYEFQAIVDMLSMRLDGHGNDIRANRNEQIQNYKELCKKADAIMGKIQEVQLKIVFVAAFISSAITLVGLFIKLR